MKAYEGIITKEEFIKEIKWHKEQDNFIQGEWFNNGKGCAVGCSLESISRIKGLELTKFDDFTKYSELLGMPEWIARLEEKIFEGLEKEDAAQWVLDFSEAVSVGQDLNKIEIPFKIWLQEENIKRVESLEHLNKEVKNEVILAIEQVIQTLKSNKTLLVAARSAARSVARSAARSVARSAARSADSAAWSADSAAWSAAESARSAARSAAYKELAIKLLELIKENNDQN